VSNSNGFNLLRLLEPAVRPDGVAGRAPGAAPAQQPLEGQDFATLLQQAQSGSSPAAGTEAQPPTGTSPPARPATNPLAQLNDVENPSVLRIAGRLGRDGE